MSEPPKSKRKSRDQAFLASQRLMKERQEPNDSWLLILDEWLGRLPQIEQFGTTDRATAIILATIVEHALERAIATHFPIPESEKMALFQSSDEDQAPLATFAAKIAIGYALGIFEGVVRSELRWIRKVRNGFAHTGRHIDFSGDDIAAMCDALQTPKLIRWGGLNGPEPKTPREKYMATVRFIFLYLSGDDEEEQPRRFSTSPFYQLFFLRQP